MEEETDWSSWRSTSTTTNCLICSSPFERKPIILGSSGGLEDLSKFKSAFRLFCKLLKSHKLGSEEEDGRSDQWMMALSKFFASAWKIETMLQSTLEADKSRTFTPPCCGDCDGALVGIYDLQKLIEENQVSQHKLMDSLGNLLIREKSSFQEKMKHQLSTTTPSSSSPPKRRRMTTSISLTATQRQPVRNENCVTYQNDGVAGLRACSVVLARCDDNSPNSCCKQTQNYQKDLGGGQVTSSPRAARKSKLKAYDVIRKSIGINEEKCHKEANKSQASEDEEDPSWSGDGGDDFCENILDSDSNEELNSPPPTSSSPPKFSSKNKESKKGRRICRKRKRKAKSWSALRLSRDKVFRVDDSSRRVSKSIWFFQLSTDLLLFKNSLIKVCRQENKMTCLESRCNFSVQGLCGSASFQEMREHIFTHLMDNNYIKWPRPCPICEQVCRAEVKFHFAKCHPQNLAALCEVCWAPFTSTTSLPSHIWSHKSEEEKKEAEARGENERSTRHKTFPLKSLRCLRKEVQAPEKNLENQEVPQAEDHDTDSSFASSSEENPVFLKKKRKRKLCLSAFGLSHENYRGEGKKRKIARSMWLFLIREDTLFLRNSLIKMSYKENQMICLEPGCEATVQGLDFSSFEQLREHIDSHLLDDNYLSKGRECPICETMFGADLKEHLFKSHLKMIAVLCEVCRKPLQKTLFLQPHLWSHKSEEEKREAEARGESETNFGYRAKLKSVRKMVREMRAQGRLTRKDSNVKLSRVAKSNWFILVNEDTLIFKNSLIKVSLRKEMTCLEDNCGWTVNGIDSASLEKVRGHVGNHVAEVGYIERERECPICSGERMPGHQLKSHLRTEHAKEISYICEVCWRPCNSATELRNHVPTHETGHLELVERANLEKEKKKEERLRKKEEPKLPRLGPQKCFWKVTENLFLLKNSLVRVNLERHRLECEEEGCGETFEGTDYSAFLEYRGHLNNCHLNEPNYLIKLRYCPICHVLSDTKLKLHLSSDHGGCTMICEICWKPLEEEEDVNAHIWSHKNEEEKVESVSEDVIEKFKEVSAFHKAEAEGKSERIFQCETCGNQFKTGATYRAHVRKHIPKLLRKHFECSYCGSKLLSQVGLRNHIIRLHRPDLQKSRVCPICSQKYLYESSSDYWRHIRSHKNERPFVCETCGKGFLSNEQLKKHGNVHLEQRAYQCEYCEMAYKHQTNLKRHQKTAHADKFPERDPEERLKCTSLRYRPDFIGPKRMFPCEICEKVFALRSRMTKHVKLRHPNKMLKEEDESNEESEESF